MGGSCSTAVAAFTTFAYKYDALPPAEQEDIWMNCSATGVMEMPTLKFKEDFFLAKAQAALSPSDGIFKLDQIDNFVSRFRFSQGSMDCLGWDIIVMPECWLPGNPEMGGRDAVHLPAVDDKHRLQSKRRPDEYRGQELQDHRQ